jgi:hypothetical protein
LKTVDKPKEKSTLSVVKDTSKEKTKLTPQEKLQKRLQLQLNKQVKLDKRKERSKAESSYKRL